MMERATKIKHQLGVQTLVCVYDQAIYAKAKEIQLKEQQKFNSIFLMMGTFHILLMSLGIVGVRFKDAGMKDVYIQSEIVAEGSIDSVLRGKQYNRAIRAHKIFWEALWCLLLEKFETEAGKKVSRSLVDHVVLSGEKYLVIREKKISSILYYRSKRSIYAGMQ